MNWWWLFSQVVYDAMEAISAGTPHVNSLINSGLERFKNTDGPTQISMFKTVSRSTVNWYCGNVYDLTQEEINAFLAEWPNDIELGGCWDRNTGSRVSDLSPNLLAHIPDDCGGRNEFGDCTTWIPASNYKQVVLLPPQAQRQFN